MRLNSDLTPQQLWTIAADSEHRDRDVLDELVSHPNSYRALSDWALAGLAVEDPKSLDVPPQPDAVEPAQKRKRRFPSLKAKKRGGGVQSGGAAPTSFSPAVSGPGVMGPGRIEPATPNPSMTGPGRIEPATPNPSMTGPGRIEPATPNPNMTGPARIEPATPNPNMTGPGRIEPATPNPNMTGPGRIEPATPNPNMTGPGRIEPATPNPNMTGPGRIEPATPNPNMTGPGRIEPATPQAAHARSGPSQAAGPVPHGSAPSRRAANQQAITVSSDPETVPIDVQSEHRRRQEHRFRTDERPSGWSQDSDSSIKFSDQQSSEIPQASISHGAHADRSPFSTGGSIPQYGSGTPPRAGISDWVSAGEQLSKSARSPEPTVLQKKADPHDVRSLPATWSSSPPPGTPLTPSAPRGQPQPANPPAENGHKHTGWAARPAPYGVVAALAALQVLTVLALLLVVVWGH